MDSKQQKKKKTLQNQSLLPCLIWGTGCSRRIKLSSFAIFPMWHFCHCFARNRSYHWNFHYRRGKPEAWSSMSFTKHSQSHGKHNAHQNFAPYLTINPMVNLTPLALMTGLAYDCWWTWEMRASSSSVRTPPFMLVVPAGLHPWNLELTFAFHSQITFKVRKKTVIQREGRSVWPWEKVPKKWLRTLDKTKCELWFTQNGLWFPLHNDCKNKMNNTKVFRHLSRMQICQTVFLSLFLRFVLCKYYKELITNKTHSRASKNKRTSLFFSSDSRVCSSL